MKNAVVPIVLLTLSNIFMTFAWYGHLRFKHLPIWVVVLASWGIAFFEYCLMIPANRWGYGHFSATELKILQEVITLIVFTVFVTAWLGERLRWNHLAAFALIVAAVGLTFMPAQRAAHESQPASHIPTNSNSAPNHPNP